MVEYFRDDFNCRLHDAGLDAVILSLVNPRIVDVDLAEQVSLAISETLSAEMLNLYIADRWAAGALTQIEHVGPMPGGIIRYSAPTDVATDGTAVWFAAPTAGTELVRWYVNTALKVARLQDLSVNRSASVAELGAAPGDVVQVAIEAGGVVGWWGRVTIP